MSTSTFASSRPYLDGPADLAIEIISPESEARDLVDKLNEYEAAKIPEYWVIDWMRRNALFFLLGEDGRCTHLTPSPTRTASTTRVCWTDSACGSIGSGAARSLRLSRLCPASCLPDTPRARQAPRPYSGKLAARSMAAAGARGLERSATISSTSNAQSRIA